MLYFFYRLYTLHSTLGPHLYIPPPSLLPDGRGYVLLFRSYDLSRWFSLAVVVTHTIFYVLRASIARLKHVRCIYTYISGIDYPEVGYLDCHRQYNPCGQVEISRRHTIRDVADRDDGPPRYQAAAGLPVVARDLYRRHRRISISGSCIRSQSDNRRLRSPPTATIILPPPSCHCSTENRFPRTLCPGVWGTRTRCSTASWPKKFSSVTSEFSWVYQGLHFFCWLCAIVYHRVITRVSHGAQRPIDSRAAPTFGDWL